jgi:6-phosphogluconolactonase
MVKKAMFDPLNISSSNIFAVNTSLSPDDAAKKYISTITDHFKDQQIRFDLILLGLGGNSHSGSLFPYTSILFDKSISVKALFLEEKNVCRITMTAPLINQARQIDFLVYDETKADAVRHVLENEPNGKKLPNSIYTS